MAESDPRTAERRVYLVEIYLPATDPAGLTDAIRRLSAACRAPVRHLCTTFVPADDTCLCLLEAASADAVRTVSVAAGLDVDRISVVRLLYPTDSNSVVQQVGKVP